MAPPPGASRSQLAQVDNQLQRRNDLIPNLSKQ
jgi:hypothetical protein